MKSVYEIIKDLRETRGTNAKMAILESHRDNLDLRRFAWMTYEPTLSYYLSPNFKLKGAGSLDAGAACDMLHSRLSSRDVTGKAAVALYETTLQSCTPEAAELVNIMLDRDFRCGVGISTLNKVWKDLVTDLPYMRCALPEAAGIKQWPWGTDGFYAISQTKADGMFANIDVMPAAKQIIVSSRAGSRFLDGPHFDAIRERSMRVASHLQQKPGMGLQFHGEFVVLDDNGKYLPREVGNGIMNSLLKKGVLPMGVEIAFLCWDVVPLEAVETRRYEVRYKDRLGELIKAMVNAGEDDKEYFGIIPHRVVYTYREAMEHFIELTKRGEEGTICKKPDMIWFDGDSMEQVKMKIVFQVELVVRGLNPGKANGKNASTFGSLQCESQCGKLAVGVTGISDKLRKEIHERGDAFLGSIVKVSSNNVMKTGDAYSLFLPRVDEIRYDKSEADDLERILAQFEAAKNGVDKYFVKKI